MGELTRLLRNIHIDKEQFSILLDKMNPLINKYVRALYKDESEDTRAELMLALWEAANNMVYIESDGKCMVYLCNALKHKFLELYRISRKKHDNQYAVEIDVLIDMPSTEYSFSEINLKVDLEHLIPDMNERKREIYYEILFEGLPDSVIAEKYQLSRQYVNRLKRKLYQTIRENYSI